MIRYCFTLLILIGIQKIAQAQQIETKALKSIKATEPYSNVAVVPVYNDVNCSAFVIFVKQQVPKHYHATHTETVIVLEGKADMYLGGEFLKIKPGDQMIIPSGVPHAVIVRSKKPLKVLSIQSPYFDNTDRILIED